MKDSVSPPLRLAAAAWEAIRADAGARAPEECCGLLVGGPDRIERAHPAGNIAATPIVRYEIDPRDHFEARRLARAAGTEVVGAYHSHPRSAPLPSATDRDEAQPDFIYLIVGRCDERGWIARAFLLRDGNFVERALVCEP